VENQLHLLGTRRFLPLFTVQFLGAFNDNVFKNAFIVLLTFSLAEKMGWTPENSVAIASGLFMLPYFLFSALAGQLADKLEKTRIIRWVKIWEILAMAIAAIGFICQDAWLLFFVLFMMGAHSTFFGPIKYSILPDHLKEKELVGGNAMIEAGTYLAILGGTLLGGLIIMLPGGLWQISIATLIVAFTGLAASFSVPKAGPQVPGLKINVNFLEETWLLVNYSRKHIGVFRCILGISWFWTIGTVWISIIPVYAKDYLHGGSSTVTFLLTLFSIGIGVGSLLCNRLLGGEVSARFVPISGIVLSLFTFDFVRLSHLLPAGEFSYYTWTTAHMAIDLIGIAVCGGIFSVPLYALLQSWSDPAYRSRNIAANNIVNAIFMVGISVVMVLLFHIQWTIPQVLALVAVINLGVSLFTITLIPESLLHQWLKKFVPIRGNLPE